MTWVGVLHKWFVLSQDILSMLLVQLLMTGMQILSKIILNQGIFIFALMTYRHIVAAFCVAPFAFFFERGIISKLNLSVCFWLFINALTGITAAMGLYYYGLRETTATYAINYLNLLPVVTFVFSAIFRIEKLRLNTKEGKCKTLGTILCAGGAVSCSLYKGKSFHIFRDKLNRKLSQNVPSKADWTVGSLLLVGSCLCYASWYMVQVKLLKIFPFKYSATMFTCMVASLQALVIGLCLHSDVASWRLAWDLKLVTIFYSGALATAASFCLLSRAIARRGPIYPPMFNPLLLIFVAVLDALLLGQAITLGILLGSLLIVAGLYSFLWAKSKELKRMSQKKAQGEEALPTTVDEPMVISTSSKPEVELDSTTDTVKP
ncbi:WAT1-related protein At1g09380-like [Mangifera indica]|uniref:WAT1-related protein At1g09380-like n=1 Tax=Mangifera indica TaxID=29780 RepID=UPI001CF99801|nr:WAT1-related protein At1g09380-like [Mangifera indica]